MFGPTEVLDIRSRPWYPRLQSRIHHPVRWIAMPQGLPKTVRDRQRKPNIVKKGLGLDPKRSGILLYTSYA